jgi:hypothetical protein
MQGVSLTRLANQQDSPGARALEFDLHRTILVARGDNGRMPIPQVGEERPCIRGWHPQEAERVRGGSSYRVSYYMDGHACPRDGRLFRDDPEREDDALTANFDRR